MVELSQVLTNIAKAIVDDPEQVSVTETTEGDSVQLELHVAEDDMGKVIGRHGKIAKSIRLVMKAAANTIGKKVTVEIK
ncbi:MAG: KH domain-containing protein [Clostridia bacterium]|nr:KH domain-containing protein [Clostridia bacterium]